MKVLITGRHFEATNPIKDYATKKILRLERFFPKILEAHIILSIEKYRHIAEITLVGKHFTVKGKETTGDMYASVDKALETIDKQLRKLSERRKEHKAKSGRKAELKVAGPLSAGLQGAGAAEEVEAAGRGDPRVVETRRPAEKPMSVGEAADELSGSQEEFLVFRDSEENRINVIYKRKDGTFGLIKP